MKRQIYIQIAATDGPHRSEHHLMRRLADRLSSGPRGRRAVLGGQERPRRCTLRSLQADVQHAEQLAVWGDLRSDTYELNPVRPGSGQQRHLQGDQTRMHSPTPP